MVYNLYNEKEASGDNVKLIIGEIARELGLSRSVAENTYNLEKAHSDPQVNCFKLIFNSLFLYLSLVCKGK